MINAYAMIHYADAKKALDRLHRELMDLNPSAARSLAEGMEETLTVHRLQLDGSLRLTLATTNPIECRWSSFAKESKRWRRGEALGLWLAEQTGDEGLQTIAATVGGTRQTYHAASGSGPGGVNYNLRRVARFNGIPDILHGIEVPPMPRTSQQPVLDRSLAQRPALMRTTVVQSRVTAFVVGHANGRPVARDRLDTPFREFIRSQHAMPYALHRRILFLGHHPTLAKAQPHPVHPRVTTTDPRFSGYENADNQSR